ncbi:MAG: sigma factor-like helix-turn-helix DNA-binding protein, partial [Planctomycetota bacterium]
AIQSEELEIVKNAINQLSPVQRKVILMRNFEGKLFPEIASAMKRTEPAVRMAWTRGVQRLSEILNDKGA